MKLLIKSIALGLSVLVLMAGSANAQTNIFVVLDGSNSMWGQVEGTAKIQTALGSLYKTIEAFPENSQAGLIAYGHREEKNCEDVETLLPLTPVTKDSFVKATENFTPKGKTPIAASLEYAAKQFTQNDANNNIVLISDGIETCGGDPCAAIKRLRTEEGLNVDVHVIGFDVDNEAQAQLKCIAEAGNGKYITASNNQGLEDAFEEVAETVAVREKKFVAKQKPESLKTIEIGNVVFHTEFDAPLSETDWNVHNEIPMLYGANSGTLTIAADQTHLQNVIVLNRELPEGDWQATITFRLDVLTGHEELNLGLYQSPEQFVFAQTGLIKNYPEPLLATRFIVQAGEKKAKSEPQQILKFNCHAKDENGNNIYDSFGDCANEAGAFKKFLKNNVGQMILSKEGNNLISKVRFKYDYPQDWVETSFPLINPFGKIALNFNSNDDSTSTIHIDEFKLEKINVEKSE